MKQLEYKLVEDAVSVNGYWIPLIKHQVIETRLADGYRCIIVNYIHYQFHRSIHEIGRPQLLDEILDLMKFINKEQNK
jgi:hypothetical protein